MSEEKKMTEEKVTLEAQLGDPSFYADKQKFSELDTKYRAHMSSLSALNADYEKAFETMMELEEKLS